MAPFSEFATHVQVGSEDGPTTVELAIFQSMSSLGSSSWSLSQDGKSYEPYNENASIEQKEIDSLIVGGTAEDTESREIVHQLKHHPPGMPMTPRQLLYLGCIWYLSADHYRKNEEIRLQILEEGSEFKEHTSVNGPKASKKQHISNNIVKPSRLSLDNATMVLQEGDYLRIHHTPRRFPKVYEVDWTFPCPKNIQRNATIDELPLVIQQEGPGYCIINKPPLIPVHSTVDNDVENVARQLYLSLKKRETKKRIVSATSVANSTEADATNQLLHHVDTPYLASVQRIDVNTSGLLVLATSPEFAAYFSQLLRYKTATVLDHTNKTNECTNTTSSPTIEKGYKCLVCIQPDKDSEESVLEAWKRLSSLQRPKSHNIGYGARKNMNSTKIIRHFLQASDRAPKLFVDQIPEDDDDSKWYECLMEIAKVGDPIPLYTSNGDDSSNLANGLWPQNDAAGNSRMPPATKAVVEVEVSLITGRTHQIRGQLSKLGFPIVGDEQYGGALQLSMPSTADGKTPENPQLLALQCCHLGFRDAEYEPVWSKKKRREVLRGRPSENGKWIRATLERAWWTPCVEAQVGRDANQFTDIDFQHDDDPAEADEGPIDICASSRTRIESKIRSDMLPPTVQLSPGRNKYVVAKLRDPSSGKIRWFVQSAPMPYHAVVAFDLLEWIAAVPGYEQTRVDVTGGGRIDYNPSMSTVSVYGFSYRYGKGDHERVANLIETSKLGSDLKVTFDLSDNLY